MRVLVDPPMERSTLREEGEPPELKHLSKGRKRKQYAMPPVTASEKGTGQTEPPRGDVVFGRSYKPVFAEVEVRWDATPQRVKAP